MTLYEKRNNAILKLLIDSISTSVLDVGCGDGRFVNFIAANDFFSKIGAVDLSERKINRAKKKCKFIEKIQFYNQSFLEYNCNFANYDAFVLSEIIEHLEKDNLQLLFKLIFKVYFPSIVILTTPNRSYNVNYEVLYNGLRHPSHIFELSENEIPVFINKLSQAFTEYRFYSNYCDDNHASHLITAIKIERNKSNEC